MHSASHRRVTRWASIFIFVTVLLGGLVCATDSSSACPAWPACYAHQVGPELHTGWLENPAIEFVHRAISFIALVLLGVTGWFGRRSGDKRVRVLPWVALACGVGSAVFGMMIILFSLPLPLGVLDLAFALVAMVLITLTDGAVRLRRCATSESLLAWLAAATLCILIAMHLLGSVVAGTTSTGVQSYTRCLSWPLWQVHDIDRFPALQALRIVFAVVALILVWIIALLSARRPAVRAPAFVSAALVVAELAIGAMIASAGLAATQTNGIDATIAVAYSAVAVTLMWALAWLLGACLPAGSCPDGAAL